MYLTSEAARTKERLAAAFSPLLHLSSLQHPKKSTFVRLFTHSSRHSLLTTFTPTSVLTVFYKKGFGKVKRLHHGSAQLTFTHYIVLNKKEKPNNKDYMQKNPKPI